MKDYEKIARNVVIVLAVIVFGSGFVLTSLQKRHVNLNNLIGPVGIATVVIVVLYMFRVPIGDKITAFRNRYARMEEEISFPQEAYIALPPVLEKEMVVEEEEEAIQSSESSESAEEVPVLHLAPNCPLPVTSALNHHLLLELPATGRTSRSVATRLYLEQLGMLEVPQLVVTLNPSYMTLLAHFPHGWVAGSSTAKDTYLPQLQTIHLPHLEEDQQERSRMRYATVREDNARPFAHKMLKIGAQVVLDLSTYEDIALAGRVLVRILTGMREYALVHPVNSVITLTQANLWVPSTRVLQSGRGMLAGELGYYMRETVLPFITKDETPGFSLYLTTPTIDGMDLRAVRGCSLWTLNRYPEEEDIPFLCLHAGLQESDLAPLSSHSILCDVLSKTAMEAVLYKHRSHHSEPEEDAKERHPAFFTGDLSSVLAEQAVPSLGKLWTGDDGNTHEDHSESSPAEQGTKPPSKAMLAYAACLQADGQLTHNALRRPPTSKTVGDTAATFAELARELGLKEAFSEKDLLSWKQTDALLQFIERLGKDEIRPYLLLAHDALAAILARDTGVAEQPLQQPPRAEIILRTKELSRWELPPLTLFTPLRQGKTIERTQVLSLARVLQQALDGYRVYGRVQEKVSIGPRVLRFHILPTGVPLMEDGAVVRDGQGIVYKSRTKIADITRIKSDLQAALKARTLRMLDPVPGTAYVGIEIPNPQPVQVRIREMLEDSAFQEACTRSKLVIALGRNVSGTVRFLDLEDSSNTHLLVAGSTGGGKSVCLNTIVASILSQASPQDVRMLMIDPKRVELVGYNGIPHLIGNVVTEPERAAGALGQIVAEMERRYKVFGQLGVRNVKEYNALRRSRLASGGEPPLRNLPAIVVVIDELAVLMEKVAETIEGIICHLAALGRAAGIHLVLATQRPTVDVLTGNIKANIPARIAFLVGTMADSRVILDQGGAEFLQGRGDMLFMRPDTPELERIQNALTEDEETRALIAYWKQVCAHVESDADSIGDRSVGGLSQHTWTADNGSVESVKSVGSLPQHTWTADNGTAEIADRQSDGEHGQGNESTLEVDSLEQVSAAFLAGEQISIKLSNLDNEQLYQLFVKPWVIRQDEISNQNLMIKFGLGQPRAARLMQHLQDEGIVGADPGAGRKRQVVGSVESVKSEEGVESRETATA